MRIAALLRVVLLAALAAGLAAPRAAAQVPPALGPEGLVFTVLGAGDERPRERLPVHRLRSLRGDVAPLPGGDLALVGGKPARAWVAGMDGRLHALPAAPGMLAVASAADGTLVAQAGDSTLLLLREDRTAWEPLLDELDAAPGWDDGEQALLAALPGGGAVFVTSDTRVWRVLPGAAPRPLAMPEETEATAVAPLPGGELLVAVEDSGGETTLMTAPAGEGPLRPLSRLSATASFGLAVSAEGTLLRASGALDVLDAGGEPAHRVAGHTRVGTGDGGPSDRARIGAYQVAAPGDGLVLVGDLALTGWVRALGTDPLSSWLYSGFLSPGRSRVPVRAFVPPGAARRALAAVAPPTLATLDAGRIAVESTAAGRATVVVRAAGAEVGRAEADVPVGRSVLTLPTPPPRADLVVELELVTADGRIAGAREPVSTLERLSRREARRQARNIGDLVYFTSNDRFSTGDCRRRSALQVVCEVQGAAGNCRGTATISQRPDGRAVRLAGRRSCPDG